MIILILFYIAILLQQNDIRGLLITEFAGRFTGFFWYYIICSSNLFLIGIFTKREFLKREIAVGKPYQIKKTEKRVSILFVAVYILQFAIRCIYLSGNLKIKIDSIWYHVIRYPFKWECLIALFAGYIFYKIFAVYKKKAIKK